MAAIDKTYLFYDQYLELVEWCKERGYVEYPDGTKESLEEYLCYDLSKEYFFDNDGNKRQFPVWNTPSHFDYWLARNCQLPYIQDRLKTQYGEETLEEMRKSNSVYDKNYTDSFGNRPTRFSVSRIKGMPNRKNIHIIFHPNRKFHSFWKVCIQKPVYKTLLDGTKLDYNEYWIYNSQTDHWCPMDLSVPFTTDTFEFKNDRSLKSVFRKIRKWKLPKGLEINVMDFYSETEYILKTK